ncbi:MAG TPA: PAS domain S-box protein [Methanoregula sp.]|nr:PAS domain S-box protein [Methanoregula sp.]
MVSDPGNAFRNQSSGAHEERPEQLLFVRLAVGSALLAAAVSVLGLISGHYGLTVPGGTGPNTRAIALSAALAWIILGSILAYSAARPVGRAARLAAQAVLVVIAAVTATEFVFSILGGHFVVEVLFVQAGTAILGPLSQPISPAAAGLAALSATALAILLWPPDDTGRGAWRTAMSLPGIAIALVSLTFLLSFAYGNPLLYGTRYIPIAFPSALAAFFTGIALVAVAGPGAAPVRYFIGDTVRARLLRVFIPLVAAIIFLENVAFAGLSSVFGIRDAVLLSASLVVFLVATAYFVARFSGRIGRELEEAEGALAKKNEDLANINEELLATGEELRQTNDELVLHERKLSRQNEDLNAINEELTSTQEELRQTIDDLTRMETVLRKSEERFRSVLDSSRDFIYRLNLQTGIYEYVSPSVKNVLGYTWEEFNALDPGVAMETVHPDDLAAVSTGLESLASTGTAEMEYRLRTKNGDYRWIANSLSVVKDSMGQPLYRGGSVRDITRRKAAEDQIQATLQRFYLILAGMPYGILLVTDEDRVEFANQAFCDIFGLTDCPETLADLTAAKMMEKIRPAYRGPDAALARISEIVSSGEAVFGENVPMSSGRFFLRDFLPVRIGEKKYGRLWIHVDITARRKAEEALAESEARFRLALKNAPVSVAMQDRDLVFRWAYNQRTWNPDEISGKSDTDLFAPEDVEWLVPLKRKVIETGSEVRVENWVTSNGRRMYLDLYIEPLRDASGKIAGIGIAAVDLTELRLAEDALKESSEKYRNLFMNMTEEVHFWKLERDEEGRIATWRLVDANPPALKTWGKTREEIVGKTTDEIFGPGATGHYMPVVQKIMAERVPHSFEDYFPNLDKYFRFTSVPFGEFFITTGADITGIKKAEIELRKKNDDLGALNEELTATQEELHQNLEELSVREENLSKALAEKEVLLSEIHHRVKNNLTAFISLLSLEGSTEETEAGRLLKLDLQNRARSMALIHETLYKTRMYDEVDMGIYLATLVEQIANTFRTGRPVKTVVDAHGVMLDIPRATPAGLIVNELVTNSLKYAFPAASGIKKGKGPADTITVALARNDGEYVMTVKDNGTGLPSGFDIETTQTLGLKLVNFLARHQMRAKIEVNRQNGTEFVFRFREKSA